MDLAERPVAGMDVGAETIKYIVVQGKNVENIQILSHGSIAHEKAVEEAFRQVLKELKERDYADIHRDHGALTKVADSIVVDTTNQSLEESVEFCLKYIKKKYPELVK